MGISSLPRPGGGTSFNMHSDKNFEALTDVTTRLERRDRDFMLIHFLLATAARKLYHAVTPSLLSLIMRL